MVLEELHVFIAIIGEDVLRDVEVRLARLPGTRGLVARIDIGTSVGDTLPCFNDCEGVT
jgi:hypothetical protein